MALCRAYCAVNILQIPKFFAQGGWFLSTMLFNFGCVLAAYSASKLVDSAFQAKSYTYWKIARKAFGPKFEIIIKLTIVVYQVYSVSVQIKFLLYQLQELFNISQIYISIILVLTFSALSFARKMQYFKGLYGMSNLGTLFVCFMLMAFCY